MKNSILTSIAVLTALASQAQTNTSVVSQTGNAQSATAVQIGSGNESIIRQLTGTGATPNTGNVASTSQVATGTGSNPNQAFVNQINGSFSNRGAISQQGGSGNQATINQNENSGGTGLFGSSATALGNQAAISQTGADNRQVSIDQNGGALGASQANDARITQVGSMLDGAGTLGGTVIEQNNLSKGNSASISQGTTNGNATRDRATLLQNDDSQRNTASISQEGADKGANVQQAGQSSDNKATVVQLGGLGDVTVLQNDVSRNNEATLTQTASAQGVNQETIFQTTNSQYNRATLEQAGTDGTALISQSDQSANNDALIRQGVGGTNNVAAVTQTFAYAGASPGASAVLGGSNSATISQNQTTNSVQGNTAVIQQGFDGGISTVTGQPVISDKNKASISQEGDVNVAQLIQGGVNNRATATQTGNNNVLKGVDTNPNIPNDMAGQFGDNNVLTVTHMGGSLPNTANVTQIGTGNVGSVTQAGIITN